MPIVFDLEQVMLQYAAQRGSRLTMRELAQETGLAESTVSRLIAGKNVRIDFGTLEVLCKFLNCQPGDLLAYIPDDAPDPVA